MNRAQRSAIVLLLASAAAAYEREAHGDLEEVRPDASIDPEMKAGGPRLRRLASAVFAWALGRERRSYAGTDKPLLTALRESMQD